ncbi:MAG: DUF5329 domain-containing protein [Deltaproteobacteria bacterium]|jgi:hypothetical protein|nr:DUF5329 domain-containing protein [Deltaproteobacteria bacterium]
MRWRNHLFIFLIVLSSVAYAADSCDTMEKEIRHLFDHLENSPCEFNRNGKWYTAEEAAAHIHQKYQYLLKKGLIDSTEQFIDRAASESSLSGKPYMVRCGASEPIKSSIWFKNELGRFRK